MNDTEQLISACMEAMYTFRRCDTTCYADGPLGRFRIDFYDRYELNDSFARMIVRQAALCEDEE